MNLQQLFFYCVIAVCSIVFFRMVNKVISMNVKEKTKARLYIYLLCFLSSFAYIASRAINGFSNGGSIPLAIHALCLLISLGIYSYLIRRDIQKIARQK